MFNIISILCIYIYDISYFYKCLLGYSSVDNHSNSMHIIIYMSSVILSNWSIHFCIISIWYLENDKSDKSSQYF